MFVNIFNLFLLPTLIFCIGFLGIVFNNRDILLILLSIELMFLGIILFLVIYSHLFYLIIGQIYAVFILCLAACESVVGLGILIAAYRERSSINLINHYLLKG